MKTYLLLLIAVVLLWVLLPVMYVYQTLAGNFSHKRFSFFLAKNIDYVGGTLFFNSDGKTISAMVWATQKMWAVEIIDWLFQDDSHCFDSWVSEFKTEKKKG